MTTQISMKRFKTGGGSFKAMVPLLPATNHLHERVCDMRCCLFGLVLLFAVVPKARGSIEFVEPDAVPVDTNITTVFPGVTLSRLFEDGSIDFGVYARDSAQFTASTGTLLFGHAESTAPGTMPAHPLFWNDRGGLTAARLRADFATATDYVAIDVFDLGSGSRGIMQAYSSTDTLLETYITDPISASFVPVVASITRPQKDIAYFTVSGYDDTVLLDNMRYATDAVIPEPTTFAIWSLLGLTATGSCWWRRRRTA